MNSDTPPFASKSADRAGSRLDRALGALLGLAVGDALGRTIEFSQRDACPPVVDMVGGDPFGLRSGEWTDDTSMALCLADSLIATKGALNPMDLGRRFLRWYGEGENSLPRNAQ
jgi:ADP-ribosyl-[dinitrogen reductase] hydrolase